MIREIVAKTITGRGKLEYLFEKDIALDKAVSKTLGCWIINLIYDVKEEENVTYLVGSYSIQLWYAVDKDQSSSVYEEKVNFKERVQMVYRQVTILDDKKYTKVFVNHYPNAVYMHLNSNNTISIKVEALFFLDVFQEAIMTIETKENAKPDMTMDEELLFNVNTHYLVERDKK